MSATDLFSLDRDVETVEKQLAQVERSLNHDPNAPERDPFYARRHVASKTTIDNLREEKFTGGSAVHRDALVTWISALLQTRLDLELRREEFRARTKPAGRFTGDAPRMVSYREALRAVLLARSDNEAELWMLALEEAAESIEPHARERQVRHLEVLRRLGCSPIAPEVATFADQFLTKTDDLARAVSREASASSPALLMRLALAREATEGWPARLSTQWPITIFGRDAIGREGCTWVPPVAIGGASFARALRRFGRAIGESHANRALPFALRRSPTRIRARRIGLAFGALCTHVEFHKRALGLSLRTAQNQARVMLRSALFEARLVAARALFCAKASSGTLGELSERLFVRALPRSLSLVLPAYRLDGASEAHALAEVLSLQNELRDAHDVDWFKNPRAHEMLRAMTATVALPEPELTDGGLRASALAIAFEEGLG